jgi:hypothetical protein
VTTLNFEAGYMHAVFLKTLERDLLQTGPSPYMPTNRVYSTRTKIISRKPHSYEQTN